jgi:hypothetical protein
MIIGLPFSHLVVIIPIEGEVQWECLSITPIFLYIRTSTEVHCPTPHQAIEAWVECVLLQGERPEFGREVADILVRERGIGELELCHSEGLLQIK